MWMWMTCLKRYETDETLYISDYSFEWFKGNKLVRVGLVINKKEDIEALIEEGFEVVD